jgi:hypothetical protein
VQPWPVCSCHCRRWSSRPSSDDGGAPRDGVPLLQPVAPPSSSGAASPAACTAIHSLARDGDEAAAPALASVDSLALAAVARLRRPGRRRTPPNRAPAHARACAACLMPAPLEPPARACSTPPPPAASSRLPQPPPPRAVLVLPRACAAAAAGLARVWGAQDWGWLGRHGIGGGCVLSLLGIFLFFYRNNRGPIRQMQVDVQVDEQVGRAPPYDHWVPRARPHPSSTYWLKHPVQRKIL